jgi:hypothetical protein
MSVLHVILIYVLELLFVVKHDDMFSASENVTNPRFVHQFVYDVHIHKLGIYVIKKAIAKLSGHVVCTHYKLPREADPLPRTNAMLIMPVTFLTINN